MVMGQVNGLEKTHHRKHNQPVNNVETTDSTTTLRRTKREKIATKANIFGTLDDDDDDDGHHNDDELPR